MTSESETTVFVCAYGRYKPGKVRQEFKFDGKIFLTGRQMTLVDDETKETLGSHSVHPEREIAEGKEFVVGSYAVQLCEVFTGHAAMPAPVEQRPAGQTPKFRPFKKPEIVRPSPYASPAGDRMMRRGINYNQPLGENQRASAPTVKQEPDLPKPVVTKNKFSLL